MARFRSPVSAAASFAACATLLFAAGPAFADSPCSAAMRANTRANSYAGSLIMHPPGKPPVSMTYEVQKPGNMHTIMRGASATEVIVINSKAWMREGSGPWKVLPEKMDMTSLFSADPMQFSRAKEVSCTEAGIGLMHGRPAHVLKSSYLLSGERQTAVMYLSTDGYLVHMDGDGPKGASSGDFTQFNQVTISPP